MPRTMVARLVSVKEAEQDPEWGMQPPDSPEERLALVIEHSRQLLRLAGFDDEQLRLRRSVCRVERRRG